MKSNRPVRLRLLSRLACFAFLASLQNFALAQPTDQDEARGLRVSEQSATSGYTLFAPLTSDTTYLVDLNGRVVHTWQSDYVPSAWVYLADEGHLWRGGRESETQGFSGGGQGGRFQEFDFDGELLWDFSINTEQRLPHHDIALLPNGNLLAVVWERKSAEEARRAGRDPDFIPSDGVWSDIIVELEPQRPNQARVVWEWHAWDHLLQSENPDLAGFAEPADHPERIDINGDSIGFSEVPEDPAHDVFHINSIAYNATLDQVMVSVPTYNEIWIIDHSTTPEEAAGGSGGRSGQGGRLLYRWGNPQVYGRGGPEDRLLGFEHDARWIDDDRPGAGNIMVFSNRTPGSSGDYTKVYELTPPIEDSGRYAISPDAPFGPEEPVWTYSSPDSFEATYISGAERLWTGNTLVTSGPQGRLFEVAPDGEIVWEYWSPFSGPPRNDGPNANRNPFAIFRAIRFPMDHPAFTGRSLLPLNPQPETRSAD